MAVEAEKVLQHGADECDKVANAIAAAAKSAQAIVNGPLSMRALCLLIRDMLPRGSKLTTDEIALVLQGAAKVGVFVKGGAR